MITKEEFGKRLRDLGDATGSSYTEISRQLGIGNGTYENYMTGKAYPPIPMLIKIADLFAVPLDYLLGRCTEEECKKIKDSYAQNYDILRRKEYETILAKKAESVDIPKGCEAPYPYNLLDDIFGDKFTTLPTDDQIAGLYKALDMLTQKEKNILILKYSGGMTLEDIGMIYNFTRNRAKQVIGNALRKLRHGPTRNYILYGEQGCDYRTMYEKKLLELNKRETALELKEKLLNEKIDLNNAMAEETGETEESTYDNYKTETFRHIKVKRPSEAFKDLNLSVRAQNCIYRSNGYTLSAVIWFIETGTLHKIRNSGKKTTEEVIDRVSEFTGINYHERYGIRRYEAPTNKYPRYEYPEDKEKEETHE